MRYCIIIIIVVISPDSFTEHWPPATKQKNTFFITWSSFDISPAALFLLCFGRSQFTWPELAPLLFGNRDLSDFDITNRFIAQRYWGTPRQTDSYIDRYFINHKKKFTRNWQNIRLSKIINMILFLCKTVDFMWILSYIINLRRFFFQFWPICLT